MRGFVIRADNFSDDLYMLLDIQNGEIKIKYEFDDYNTQTTLIDKVERELTLSLGGNQINTLKNSAFESAIEQRFARDNDARSSGMIINANASNASTASSASNASMHPMYLWIQCISCTQASTASMHPMHSMHQYIYVSNMSLDVLFMMSETIGDYHIWHF